MHHDLKNIDDVLRAAMNRRDRLTKSVNKHARQVVFCESKIKKALKKLDQLSEDTAENVAGWTDNITLHEDYKIKATSLLEVAEMEVNTRLDELGAL